MKPEINSYLEEFDENYNWLYRNICGSEEPNWIRTSDEVKSFLEKSLQEVYEKGREDEKNETYK